MKTLLLIAVIFLNLYSEVLVTAKLNAGSKLNMSPNDTIFYSERPWPCRIASMSWSFDQGFFVNYYTIMIRVTDSITVDSSESDYYGRHYISRMAMFLPRKDTIDNIQYTLKQIDRNIDYDWPYYGWDYDILVSSIRVTYKHSLDTNEYSVSYYYDRNIAPEHFAASDTLMMWRCDDGTYCRPTVITNHPYIAPIDTTPSDTIPTFIRNILKPAIHHQFKINAWYDALGRQSVFIKKPFRMVFKKAQ